MPERGVLQENWNVFGVSDDTRELWWRPVNELTSGAWLSYCEALDGVLPLSPPKIQNGEVSTFQNLTPGFVGGGPGC